MSSGNRPGRVASDKTANPTVSSGAAALPSEPEENVSPSDALPLRAPGELIDPQPAHVAAAPGGKSVAWATVNGVETPALLPNQAGEFPRVYAALGEQCRCVSRWMKARRATESPRLPRTAGAHLGS